MEGVQLLDTKPTRATGSLVIHDNFANRIAFCAGDGSFKFLPYQLSTVG